MKNILWSEHSSGYNIPLGILFYNNNNRNEWKIIYFKVYGFFGFGIWPFLYVNIIYNLAICMKSQTFIFIIVKFINYYYKFIFKYL